MPVVGSEVNGAKRWINLGIAGFQPSEFLKPAFAILLAWIVSWRMREPNLPVLAMVTGVMGLVAALMMMQPDFGGTILFGGVWFVIVVLAGIPLKRVGALAGAGVVAITATYFLYDNARHRIDAFLGGGTAFDQVDLASRTLLSGGWTGTGLWLGVRKMNLPEAHTDYIFSVIGEEFGLLACALIVALFLAIVVRVLVRLVDEEDLFTLLAAAGLTTQIGGQAFINILVNLQLFPSKGMTLPLVSYGGSSTIAVCLGGGAAGGFDAAQPLPLSADARPQGVDREGTEPMTGASRHYVLAAGGTGGHLVPAFVLAGELHRRGHHVALVTDARGAAMPGKPDFLPAHVIPASKLGKNPLKWPAGIKAIMEGRAMARRLYDSFAPSAVVGFGGYPVLPALLAAISAEVPTVVHDQNAVLGRVNRFFAGRVDAIATAYPEVARLLPKFADKVHLVGNPVRPEVVNLRDQPFPAFTAGRAAAGARHRRQPGRARAERSGARRAGDAPARAAPAAAGDPAVPRGGHRGGARALSRARHPCRTRDLLRGHGEPAGRRAPVHRPRGRDDRRRTDRGGPPGHPRAAADRDRRSPGRQHPRGGQGGRRADDPAGQVHRQGTRQADPGDGAASRNARHRGARRRGTAAGPGRPRISPISSRASAGPRLMDVIRVGGANDRAASQGALAGQGAAKR